MDVFVKFAGDYYLHGGTKEFIHPGAAYRLTPRKPDRFHCAFGLTAGTPNHFLTAGYSFRLDNVFRAKTQLRIPFEPLWVIRTLSAPGIKNFRSVLLGMLRGVTAPPIDHAEAV
jgi:hypothetical protein